jgi:predicted acetyltransferase
VQLALPDKVYESSYRDYIEELGDEERYPFPLDFDHSDFDALLTRLAEFSTGVAVPNGFVPATTYWLVDGRELVGVSSLRHHLNDRIRHAGGHIGLGIRPSRRAEGLGSLLLRLTLDRAFERGITPVHVHCHQHNEASARMITGNGGVLDSEVMDDGEVVQRYLFAR